MKVYLFIASLFLLMTTQFTLASYLGQTSEYNVYVVHTENSYNTTTSDYNIYKNIIYRAAVITHDNFYNIYLGFIDGSYQVYSIPHIVSYSPNSTSSSSVTITVITDINSTCRYSTDSTVSYGNMTNYYTDNGTLHSLVLAGLASGRHIYYSKCNSTQGIVNDEAYNIIVDVSISSSTTATSSSGGGGGGAPAASEILKQVVVIDAIHPSEPLAVTNTVKDSGLNALQITVNTDISSATLTIEKTRKNPVSMMPSGNVYKYISVSHTIPQSAIKSVKFVLNVEKSWMDDNEIDADKIYLERYEAGLWERYPASRQTENNTHTIYKAVVPGLSYFAITGENRTKGCPSEFRCNGKYLEECANSSWIIKKVCNNGCDSSSYECRGEYPQVKIYSISSKEIPVIEADAVITNEGYKEEEYQYRYCIVDSENTSCKEVGNLAYASGAKLLKPGESWNPALKLTINDVKSVNPDKLLWFKLIVLFGSGKSEAYLSFYPEFPEDNVSNEQKKIILINIPYYLVGVLIIVIIALIVYKYLKRKRIR